jgi:hypothetical protein
MARKVFFSFHYQDDIFRVNQVRKSNVIEGVASAGFIDASLWEKAEKAGESTIKRMIDDALYGTSVTVVLIGANTARRKYINYEIMQSYKRGNGLFGIYIHNLKDINRRTTTKGADPFDSFLLKYPGNHIESFSKKIDKYDWYSNDGYQNFDSWIEKAYNNANKNTNSIFGFSPIKPNIILRPSLPFALPKAVPASNRPLGILIKKNIPPPKILLPTTNIPKTPKNDLLKLLTPRLFNLPKKK